MTTMLSPEIVTVPSLVDRCDSCSAAAKAVREVYEHLFKGGAPADLKDKTIAVNNGSFSDRWLHENPVMYGYKIQRFNKNTDAVQAVAIGRAFANMSETPLARYIATKTPALAPVYDMTTEANYAFAFRKDDTALRNRVDEVLECMKQDGSLSKLHVKWFGTEPNAGTAMTVVFPGYGAPDFPGYEPTEHTPDCSRP